MNRKEKIAKITIPTIVVLFAIIFAASPASANAVNFHGNGFYEDVSPAYFDQLSITNTNTNEEWNQSTVSSVALYQNIYALSIDDPNDITSGDILKYVATNGTWTNTSYATYTGSDLEHNITFPLTGDPDLIVESTTLKCGYLFGNGSNEIFAKIKNSGTTSAGAFNVSFEAGSFFKQVRVSGGLAAGANTTVSVTDPTIRNAGSFVTIDVIADCNGEITELNEGNNALSRTETVVNNGYKGKTYTGGSNITTWKTFDLNGDMLYSTGDSQYMSGSGSWEHMNVTWTASDLLVPGTAAVKEARLYVPYCYAADGAMPNNYSMEFNGNPVTFDMHYWDTKWYDRTYPYYGMLVYNVTTDFSTSGNTANFTSLWSGLPTHSGASMRGMVLAVIYEDSSASEKKILINEEFDMLYGGTSKCTTPEEATAYAPFAGSIDLTTFKTGKLITMAPGAGPNEGELIFNGHTWTNVWNFGGSTQIGIDEHDVSSYLQSTDNEAGFQSSGDWMEASNAFLVLSIDAPDLIVESITPNCVSLFGNGSNKISAKIKNSGTASAGAFNVSFAAGSFYKQVSVSSGLAAGANTTVSVIDPTIRNAGSSVTIDVIADSNGEISELNEGNNALSRTETVLNNGYKGKTYTGGSNISTWKTFDLNGDLLYSVGDSYYLSASVVPDWTSYNVNWAASELPVPGTATVREARLYIPYTWAKPGLMPGYMSLTFNGNSEPLDKHYWDRSGWGSYDNPYGMLVYNVTANFSTGGNVANLINSYPGGGSVSMRGMVLAVIYEDSNAWEKKILINEEFDMLYGGTYKCTTPEEATAFAPFAGSIDLNKYEWGKLITMAPGAGPNEGELIFNGNTWTNVWNFAGSTQIGIDEHDVSSYLQSTNNEAGFQSSGDWMEASNAFLVLTSSIEIDLGSWQDTEVGRHIMIPITANDLDKFYGTVEMNLSYEASKFDFVAVHSSSDSIVTAYQDYPTLGILDISAWNQNGVKGDVVLATVELEVVDGAGTDEELSLTVDVFEDIYGTSIKADLIPTTISIKDPAGELAVTSAASTPESPLGVANEGILNENGRLRHTGDNETVISAVVTDAGLGIDSVTVDLSAIGGSANTLMSETSPGSGTYSVTTTATTGIDGTHTFVVTATDNGGNIATDTTNVLTVYRRGDVTENNKVDMGDALCIAKYTVGLENPTNMNHFNFVGDTQPAFSNDDHLTNMGDALFIARYTVGLEPAP